MKPFVLFLFIFFLSFSHFSCQQDKLLEFENVTDKNVNILGKKLENPYSLKNMQQAYINLKAKSKFDLDDIELFPTHWYVRFLPNNHEEYLFLKEKCGLELFSYPLDHEVTEWIASYFDPELQDNQITWQYTRVPYGYEFPMIRYELLDELYMPWLQDNDGNKVAKTTVINNNIWQSLISEAFDITENDKGPYEKIIAKNGEASVAVPLFVYAWDDEIQTYVPVKGVKVKLTGFTEWGVAYTNESGFALFQGTAISTAHRIDISWEDTQKWYIIDGSVVASTTGPYINYAPMYYINISSGNASLLYATMQRAIYNYFNNTQGIRVPDIPYYFATHGCSSEDDDAILWQTSRFRLAVRNWVGYGSSSTVPPNIYDLSANHVYVDRYLRSGVEHTTTDWEADSFNLIYRYL